AEDPPGDERRGADAADHPANPRRGPLARLARHRSVRRCRRHGLDLGRPDRYHELRRVPRGHADQSFPQKAIPPDELEAMAAWLDANLLADVGPREWLLVAPDFRTLDIALEAHRQPADLRSYPCERSTSDALPILSSALRRTGERAHELVVCKRELP